MFYDHEGQILEPYSKAPLEVLHHKKIKDFSKLLYFELYSIHEQNKHKVNHLFIKDETLAEKFGVSLIYIKKSMKDLEDNNLIHRETSAYDGKRQAKKRKIYLIPLKSNRHNQIIYTVFPKSLYKKEDINNLEKIILIELMSLIAVDELEDDSCSVIDINRLANTLEKHRRTILNNLNNLANKNYINIAGAGSERTISIETSAIFDEGLYL